MEFPVDVALAEAVPRLPVGPGWWYEIKFDGHRAVLWREAETARVQARSGRDVTSAWMDLALAAFHTLLPGTVLDGEAVIYKDGLQRSAVAGSFLSPARPLPCRAVARHVRRVGHPPAPSPW
jgi:ATP-dependent DNA ligase